MDDDWWPDLLRYIPEEAPWDGPKVVVAEIKGYDDPGFSGVRFLTSALVPSNVMATLGGQLSSFHFEVEASGPHPDLHCVGQYEPEIWISLFQGSEHIKCEPLVQSWTSNNRTAMVLDPRFAMTYGLMPRPQSDGTTHWDDPAAPEYDVAVVAGVSRYGDDLRYSDALVIVSRDHLQDYLTLRGMVLVQVYYETRRGHQDAAIEEILVRESAERITEKLKDKEIDVWRDPDGKFVAQVWGARVVAGPGDLPISRDPLDAAGLNWPGLNGPLNRQAARAFLPLQEYVYINDSVLGAYEGKEGFSIHPGTGGVAFENQWSVGHAKRTGRDTIELDVRDLYAGTPYQVIRHWHSHAVAPPAGADPVPNIGTRSEAVVSTLVSLGRKLCHLSQQLGIEGFTVENFIGLDPKKLDYYGWWNGPHVASITYHVPHDLTQEEFLNRCLAFDKVVIEGLGERYLRRLVKAIGKQTDTTEFRSLKLLDRVVCLADEANEAGLSLPNDATEVLARFSDPGSKARRPLQKMFALSDLRQVAGHRKNANDIVPGALERLNIDPKLGASGWGLVLDSVYDRIIGQLQSMEASLDTAIIQ